MCARFQRVVTTAPHRTLALVTMYHQAAGLFLSAARSANAVRPLLLSAGSRALHTTRPLTLAPAPLLEREKIRWRYGRPVMKPVSAVTVPDAAPSKLKTFEEIGLRGDLIKGLQEMGIEKPTEIQQAAFEQVRRPKFKYLYGISTPRRNSCSRPVF